MNELITIKQLPVLEEEFNKLGAEVENKLAKVKTLVVSEETRQDVKSLRTKLNKEAKEYASQFKTAKTSILEPWEAKLEEKKVVDSVDKIVDKPVERPVEKPSAKPIEKHFTLKLFCNEQEKKALLDYMDCIGLRYEI